MGKVSRLKRPKRHYSIMFLSKVMSNKHERLPLVNLMALPFLPVCNLYIQDYMASWPLLPCIWPSIKCPTWQVSACNNYTYVHATVNLVMVVMMILIVKALLFIFDFQYGDEGTEFFPGGK